MKRMIALMAAVVLGAQLTQGIVRAEGEKDFVFSAEKLGKAAVVDGVAEKSEYPAGLMTLKQTPEREMIQSEPAKASAFHDGKVLYVSVTVPVKSDAKLSKGESWSQDDGAEVCFRDASGTKAGSTFVIHGFVTGKHECTTDGGAGSEEAAKLDKAVKFSAKVDQKSWTGEWAIPLESAGINYKPGMSLDFNIGVWRSDGGEWIIWRGAQGATYQLENGGKLTLK